MGALPRPKHALPDDEPEEFGVQLAPLVDIVFLLLVFFLVATTYLDEEKDLAIEVPRVSLKKGGSAARLERVLLNVRSDGTVLLGLRPVGRNELYRTLVEARRANPAVPVIIRGDRAASHGEMMEILSICQRARVRNIVFPVVPKGMKDTPAPSATARPAGGTTPREKK